MTALKTFIARFLHDQRGVSAIEFALLAPVMITLYFASSEFCQAFMVQRRMDHATSQIADITSQDDVVTRDELDDIFAIAPLIISPFPTAPLKVRVSGVTRDANGVAKIDWSRGSGLSALSVGSEVTIPAGMIANGESVVLSESAYDYVSPLGYMLPDLVRFRRTLYLRPRLEDKVICSDC